MPPTVKQRRWPALLLAIAVAAALIAASFWASHFHYRNTATLSDVKPIEGAAYSAPIPFSAPSDDKHPFNSSLVLLEDGRRLGPAHADDHSIGENGHGTFIVHKDRLVFSTSDNSNPSTNGRRYTIEQPRQLPTILLFVLALPGLAAFCVAWYLAHQLAAGRFRAVLDGAATLILIILCLEMFSTVMLADLFGRQGVYEKINALVFAGSHEYPELETFGFSPHHYLFYSLNPAHGDQTNATYLVRRGEAIRPRSEVATRILAVGGSTTFDTKIGSERDTWVGRLEGRLRQRYGNGYDVINGGVGGYTIYENFIHYITLLTYLDPDIVILFEGINDVHPRFYGKLALDYRNYNLPRWDKGSVDLAEDRSLWAGFATYRFWQLSTKYKGFINEGVGRLTREPYPAPATWQESLRSNPPSLYRSILENFVMLMLAQGRKVVIVPQHIRPLTPNDEIFAQGLRENNAVDEAVAKKFAIPYLAEIGESATFGPGDMADNVHFSEAGAAKMADIVNNFLLSSGLLPR